MLRFFSLLILVNFLIFPPCNSLKLQDIDSNQNTSKFGIENFSVETIDEKIVQNCLVNIVGRASYYAHKFHNKKTASGERFDMYGYTAAHRKLPFGSIIKVTNLKNNKSTLVRVNDRGPHRKNRIIDLSYRVAKNINGLHLPTIYITHFNYQKLISKFDTNYFIGYSISRDFTIVHKSKIKILDTIPSQNFEEVINSFIRYDQIPNITCYIFTKTSNPTKQDTCYIGILI